jgi:hypothetical protein
MGMVKYADIGNAAQEAGKIGATVDAARVTGSSSRARAPSWS